MNSIVFLLHLAFAVMLIRYLRSLQLKGIPVTFSALLFAGKCLLTWFLFGYFKESPQPMDSGTYLHDATIIGRMFLEDPGSAWGYITGQQSLPAGYINSLYIWDKQVYLPFFNDNYTIVLLNVLIDFVSFGSSGVHLVWMSMLGWIGLCRLSEVSVTDHKFNWFSMIPFMVPQILIWNSLVLKEPLLIFNMGFLLAGISAWSRNEKHGYKYILIGLVGFIFVKTIYLVMLIPAILAFVVSGKLSRIQPAAVFGMVLLIVVTTLILVSSVSDSFHVPSKLFGHQLSMYRFVVYSHATSILEPLSFAPSWFSLLKRTPESIFYSLLQPLPWLYDVKLAWLLFAENVFVLLFLLHGLIRNRKVILNSRRRLMYLTSGLMILAVVGFISPVAGTLIRFKMPGILLLMLGVVPSHNTTGKSLHTRRETDTPNLA